MRVTHVALLEDAHACVHRMINAAITSTFWEVYGRGEVGKSARTCVSRRNAALKGLGVIDLRTCQIDDTPWGLSL